MFAVEEGASPKQEISLHLAQTLRQSHQLPLARQPPAKNRVSYARRVVAFVASSISPLNHLSTRSFTTTPCCPLSRPIFKILTAGRAHPRNTELTMEDPTLAPLSHKRPHDEDAEPQPSTPVKAISSEASTPLSVLSNIQTPSPMQSTIPSTSSNSAADQSSTQTATSSSSAQLPSRKKRRVLTQQEKDDAAREREVKAKSRADKAAQKEAEAKLKADEKAQKAAQKEAEIKAKADEKAKKEADKREKEEEKAKKERVSLALTGARHLLTCVKSQMK